MIKSTNETIVRVDYITKDGKHEFQTFDEEKVSEKVAELQAEGATAEVKFAQSFTYYNVSGESPLDDLAKLVDNPVEQANIINRALDIKQNTYVRNALKQDNFTPVEGSFDLAPICAAMAERKSASPEEKAAAAMSKLAGRTISVEELTQILAAMGASA